MGLKSPFFLSSPISKCNHDKSSCILIFYSRNMSKMRFFFLNIKGFVNFGWDIFWEQSFPSVGYLPFPNCQSLLRPCCSQNVSNISALLESHMSSLESSTFPNPKLVNPKLATLFPVLWTSWLGSFRSCWFSPIVFGLEVCIVVFCSLKFGFVDFCSLAVCFKMSCSLEFCFVDFCSFSLEVGFVDFRLVLSGLVDVDFGFLNRALRSNRSRVLVCWTNLCNVSQSSPVKK